MLLLDHFRKELKKDLELNLKEKLLFTLTEVDSLQAKLLTILLSTLRHLLHQVCLEKIQLQLNLFNIKTINRY